MTPRACITDGCPCWAPPRELACFACDVEARGGPSPYYARGPVTLYKGDVRNVSPWWRRRGHTIWDPPYSRHVHEKSRAGARDMPLFSGDGKIRPASISRAAAFGFESLTPDLRRYMAREAVRLTSRWSLVFSDSESSHLWRVSLQAGGDQKIEHRILIAEAEAETIKMPGLEYVRTMFWDKMGGAPQFTGDRPAVACEAITVMHAADATIRWNGGGKRGIYAYPIVLDRGGHGGLEPRLHTAQKPKCLTDALEQDFTDPERALADGSAPADLIYDFTAGVCTSGVSAIGAEGGARFWVGCELDPEVEIDECRTCGKGIAAHGDHQFNARKRSPDVCRGCGRSQADHGHPFEPVYRRVWAERGALRLDAELSGSTYSARSAGQLSLLDRMGAT